MARHIDPHDLETDAQRVFWGVKTAADVLGRPFVTAAEVSEVLAGEAKLAVSRQRVMGILESAGAAIRRKKISGKRHFQLMREGEEAIGDGGSGALLVDPTNGLEAIRQLEDMFATLTGIVRVCDPYVDNKTLDFLASMQGASELRLLTHNVLGERSFRRDLAALRRQLGYSVEVRVTPSADNHDRYVIADNAGFVVGSSLNGFAKKRSFVMPITQLRRHVLAAFDQDWNRATKLA